MFNHLKIVVTLFFFVFASGEKASGRPLAVIDNVAVQVKMLAGAGQKAEYAGNSTVSVLKLKIKRKCKATENVAMYFFYNRMGAVINTVPDLQVNTPEKFKTHAKNNLQCKRGPPSC